MAALGAPSEETLRGEQAREQAGIEGLTNALTGRISGFVGQTGAGLAGLGNLYGNIVGQARTGAESALAAAGAAPGLVSPAGPSEAVASQMANIGGALAGFVPAAATTGAQIAGTSRSNLTKALAERAATISGNTAKYLQQLRDDEYQRAVAQLTVEQNAARLGLSEQKFAADLQDKEFGRNLDLAKLNLSQKRLALDIQKANKSLGKDTKKKIASTKDRILNNADKWTTGSTGEYVFKITYNDVNSVPRTVEASGTSEQQAVDKVAGLMPANVVSNQSYLIERGAEAEGRLPNAAVIAKVTPILVGAGMSRKNARLWIIRNLLGGA
jgi:hypothetical protein